MTPGEIIARIKEKFPMAQVRAQDMTGGGDHWQVVVETADFQGKSLVEQHQMVYGALGDWMKEKIHALKLDTVVPKT